MTDGLDSQLLKRKRADGELAKKKRKKQRKSEASIRKDDIQVEASFPTPRGKSPATWSVSAPIGGWFLPQDPLFSLDEKYLFLADTRSVQVYSTETSLPIRTLAVGYGYISAYALSSTNPEHLYVANSSGLVTQWDWTNGTKTARWEIKTNIRQMTVVSQAQSNQDLVFCHEVENSHKINVHALRTLDQASQTELKQVLKSKSAISGFQVLLEGMILIVACQNSIAIGKRAKLHRTAVQDFEYTWREFRTTKRITAFNAYVRIPQASGKNKDALQDSRIHLNLAFGDENGVIYLFDDMLSSFARFERSQKDSGKTTMDLDTLRPKRLHWHRDAVRSLKWSKDANYLISGGKETVLVIWQLSTGKQQHLPHLTASIENIVVSPSGASYSVFLANNSIIVLSTSELVAKTNIVGTQSRRIELEQMPRASTSNDFPFDIFHQVPMAVHTKNPSQVMLSVPSSQPRNEHLRIPPPQPYLQTFDFATQLHVSRQALTRNNATDLNTGPDKTKIQEPNVKFIQVSHDGRWLATVDEWTPPPIDMGYLEEGIPEFNEEERLFRRETYLKFWSCDEKSAQWTLESRIDAPHSFDTLGTSAQVFDLISEPTKAGFATVGEDRFVRIWRPKTRLRDGMTVRGNDKRHKEGLVTWSLDWSIELCGRFDILDSSPSPHSLLNPRNSRLAVSADGSVLAAGVSWSSDANTGVIHILDAEKGTVRRSITELDVTALSCLGLVGRYLVAISDSIMVWDLVVDELVFCVPVELPGIDRSHRPWLIRLATNENDGTFAVTCPQFEKNETSKSRGTRYFKKATTKIFVFEPQKPQATWSSTVPDIVLALQSMQGRRGYVILDSTASVRLVNRKAVALQLITPPPEPTPELVRRRKDIKEDEDENEDEDRDEESNDFTQGQELLPDTENDKPVVTPQQLQEIFDLSSSNTLPPVKELFNAVVGLYARKPKAQ
ncbi:WD40 repeat-like protein [Lindgomyces ingoldianus]|uniref:WD40 repeat-like protein n=1 Tax=Lindgomyces ingoldianus TaxID=673940 RepID=A0ACB6R276_9PLEO|nr:WD40 repeat-like protein [Lindgomyces ingoldianus]KAF2473246.1 WD40 repeat-like protein [Lindgomyces ingoldianus]